MQVQRGLSWADTHLFLAVLLVEVYPSLAYMPSTSHQISRIKWTVEVFCAFSSLKCSYFFSKFEPFLFGVRFLGHFCTYLVTDQDYFVIFTKRLLMICTSCKTSYNILSRSPVKKDDAKCTAFLVKMSFICMKMKNHFHIKGWELNLVLIQRPVGTRTICGRGSALTSEVGGGGGGAKERGPRF